MPEAFRDVKVTGVGFRPAGYDTWQALEFGAVLRVVREPENKYDMNAIMVYYADTHIGYINKDEAAWIAPCMDDNPDVSWIGIYRSVTQAARTIYPYIDVVPSEHQADSADTDASEPILTDVE